MKKKSLDSEEDEQPDYDITDANNDFLKGYENVAKFLLEHDYMKDEEPPS